MVGLTIATTTSPIYMVSIPVKLQVISDVLKHVETTNRADEWHFAMDLINDMRGCSSVVERMLCMYEAPGSIPGISSVLLESLAVMKIYPNKQVRMVWTETNN